MASIISAGTTSGTALNMTGDTSGQLQLATNGSTTAVTIDASQLVGIGTTPVGAILHVGSANDTTIRLTKTSQSDWGLQTLDSGVWRVYSYTATTERMRIDSTGRLLVGVTSTGGQPAGAVAAVGYASKAGTSGAFSNNAYNFYWTTGLAAYIDTTNIGNVTISSDYRIKKNVETQTTPALDRIAQIRPVTYEFANYKELFKEDGVAREGFIAHELAEVIPSAVDGEKDAENQIQSLKLDALCSVMVKAIQEQQTIINDLKARITALEGAA